MEQAEHARSGLRGRRIQFSAGREQSSRYAVSMLSFGILAGIHKRPEMKLSRTIKEVHSAWAAHKDESAPASHSCKEQ